MPTLMAVHAHPDDEGIQTGGVLALAAARGIDTVLVTCTNGEMGDSAEGLKPDRDGHDPIATAAMRLRELRAAAAALHIGELELLGYRDSGMMGWPQNDAPGAFWKASLEEATERLAELMQRHRPDVLVTYDREGLYGHPDHIQAHRAAVAAATRTGIPRKIYEIAFPRSLMKAFADLQREEGADDVGDGGAEGGSAPAAAVPEGIPDELITTTVDVTSAWEAKRAAIFMHQSQLANFGFLKLDDSVLSVALGTEFFVRTFDTTGTPLPETDLFAGID